jgi:hypothetical protein
VNSSLVGVDHTDVENVPMARVFRRNGCLVVGRIMSFVNERGTGSC